MRARCIAPWNYSNVSKNSGRVVAIFAPLKQWPLAIYPITAQAATIEGGSHQHSAGLYFSQDRDLHYSVPVKYGRTFSFDLIYASSTKNVQQVPVDEIKLKKKKTLSKGQNRNGISLKTEKAD